MAQSIFERFVSFSGQTQKTGAKMPFFGKRKRVVPQRCQSVIFVDATVRTSADADTHTRLLSPSETH
jgi:hypothetical protein